MEDDDVLKVSIAELCKPLSAKVMPRRSLYAATGGNILDEQEAIRAQRQEINGKFTQRRKRLTRKK